MSVIRGPYQDYSGGELRNWRFQNASSAPSSPTVGMPYFDTAKGGVFIWNGTAQRPTDAALLTDGTIKIAALEVDPRARGTHTGQQAASTISDLKTTVTGYTLDLFASPINPLNLNNQRITLLAQGSAGTDATNLTQVNSLIQAAVQGVNAIKSPARIATDANITLSGLQTLQGVALADGDRVLVRAQTDGTKNLIYNAHSGAWTIAVDDDSGQELVSGTQILINEGTYAGSAFRITTLGTITIGTTSITWTQAIQPGSYSADEITLHLASGVFSARLGNGLTSVTAGIQILPAPNYGLQVTSAGVGILLPANSGLVLDNTGLHIDRTSTTRPMLFTSGTFSGDGSKTSWTFVHNLNNRNPVVGFQDSSFAKTDFDWTATDANTLTITSGLPPANGSQFFVSVGG